jgi:capsular polysaccharide transport system permease protein
MLGTSFQGPRQMTGVAAQGGALMGFAPPPAGADLLPRLFNPIDQIFILRALILRQIRITYRKSRFGFVLAFAQPGAIMVLHITLITFYCELTEQALPAGIPCDIFMIVGFTIWFIFSHAAHGPKHSIGEGPGAMFMPLVTRMQFRLAATLWEFVAMSSLCLFGLLLSQMIHGDEAVPNIPLAFVFFVLAAILGFGTRLVLDALSERWQVVRSFEKLLFRCLFITSAIFYSAINIHKALGDWIMYNPMIHIVEEARGAFYPGYPVFDVSLIYPTIWAFGMTLVGLVLNVYSKRWKKVN